MEQNRLDAILAEFETAYDASVLARYGVRAQGGHWWGVFTHQFLHLGILHLVFNMWFLWLVGCNIEDSWGRVIFPLFYVGAGIAAAYAQMLSAPHSTVPMVGASGAVAGAMGAFLVVHARTKIRFFTLLLFRPIFFSAPAYLMLPLWAGGELFSAAMAPADQGGVAYWAHVGGFAAGAAVALVMRLTGGDRRIDRAIENQGSFVADPRLLQAGELIDNGQPHEAIVLLSQLASEQNSLDVQLELLRAARAAANSDLEIQQYARVIEMYLRQGADDAALQLYDEVVGLRAQHRVPAALRLRVAARLQAAQKWRLAADTLSSIYQDPMVKDQIRFSAMLAQARVYAAVGQLDHARQLLASARAAPGCDPSAVSSAELDLSAATHR